MTSLARTEHTAPYLGPRATRQRMVLAKRLGWQVAEQGQGASSARKRQSISDAGHYVRQERPKSVTATVVESVLSERP